LPKATTLAEIEALLPWNVELTSSFGAASLRRQHYVKPESRTYSSLAKHSSELTRGSG
jgi:hypothetical protein